jgi:hypothetical protein
MDLQDRIKNFLNTYQTIGWLLGLMVGALLIQGILILVFPEKSSPGVYENIILHLTLPGSLLELVTQPWSLVTWPFFHSEFWFLWTIFAGMMLFTFGQIHQQFLNETRTRRAVMLAIPLIGLLTVTYSTFLNMGQADPAVVQTEQVDATSSDQPAPEGVEEGVADESKSVEKAAYTDNSIQRWGGLNPAFPSGMFPILMLLMIGTVTLVPHYPIQMFLFGQVEIRWVGGIFFIIIWAISGFFSPWGFAILLGGLLGFLNVYLLRKDIDVTDVIWSFYKEEKKPRMKVKYTNPQSQSAYNSSSRSSRSQTSKGKDSRGEIGEDQIDQILDKINATGYDSLSREEKELLFKASTQKEDEGTD